MPGSSSIIYKVRFRETSGGLPGIVVASTDSRARKSGRQDLNLRPVAAATALHECTEIVATASGFVIKFSLDRFTTGCETFAVNQDPGERRAWLLSSDRYCDDEDGGEDFRTSQHSGVQFFDFAKHNSGTQR